MSHNTPATQHTIPEDIRAFWISDYECWAGRSMEECIEASMREWGVSRDEAFDEAEAHEVPREDWDSTQIPNDPDENVVYRGRGRKREIDWDATPWCTLRELVAEHDEFPTYLGGRE